MEKAFNKTKFLTSKNIYSALLGGVFFLFFSVFTFLVKIDLLNKFDFDITVRFQDYLSKHLRLQEFFCSLSIFGQFEILIFILVVLLIIRRKWIGAFIAFGLFGFAHVLELIGKLLLHHPNPPQFFIKCHGPTFPTHYVQPGYSYPSGHSLRTVFIAIIALYFIYTSKRLPQFFKLLSYASILAIVAFMLISRISLGEHWPTDVIGGSLLGTSFALFSILFL